MKWYEYRDMKTGEFVWWTQRDKNGNCFEIRELLFSMRLRLFVNEVAKKDYDTLIEAQQAVRAEWVD